MGNSGEQASLQELQPTSNVSPVNSGDQDMSTADSTMTLLNKTVTSVAAKREETWSNVPAPLSSSQVNEQVVSNHSKISSSVGQPCPKPSYMETVSEWKIPARICREISPEVPPPVHSNDCIVIKGKTYYVLKQIGRGGSSKVFQVLDHKKQLFAVKYVDLEDADNQTIESYKNEIEHLNRLQQHSDQIIKLYDYEMTNNYIYMLMECGNLDLNSWLRSKKAVNPLERKFYWKNMLEAVQTIHRHGIIHSDLKPANFVIVNASLKLIDFGIANQIQPDVTSIVKDSQVGTLNYMPPEAIKDNSSIGGKPRSKNLAKMCNSGRKLDVSECIKPSSNPTWKM
ncbi:UNVERIFIED_CONTAM: hypothetical protein FKN15_056612 [Acipenser sinensis]